MHTLGVVDPNAPNECADSAHHVCDDIPNDLMYKFVDDFPQNLDLNHRDYWQHGSFAYFDLARSSFLDEDGVPDQFDNCPGVANANQANNDGDAQGDACDTDDDNDGVLDASDNCQFTANVNQANNDGDAQGDACDTDDDNDGVLDASDNCQFIANADQLNNDRDSQGDACDADDDNDGVLDVSDNCRFTPNASQANNDGDSLGDACDVDDDNDSVLDLADNCQFVANADQTDADGDSLGDACDAGDTDADGFSDRLEYRTGTSRILPRCGANTWPADINNDTYSDISDITFLTGNFGSPVPPAPARYNIAPDPPDVFVDITDISRLTGLFGRGCDSDTDGDGVPDGFDNCWPSIFNPEQRNIDGDLEGDACDGGDFDGDQFSDRIEYFAGTDPGDACPDNPSDAAWPPDFNNDSTVDISDLSFVGAYDGQSVPPAPTRVDIAPDPPDKKIDDQDRSAVLSHLGSCSQSAGDAVEGGASESGTSGPHSSPRVSLDMDPTGNGYADATNTMTVGPVDECLTMLIGNNVAHNHATHLVIQDIEDLVGWQVRLNYDGGKMRPLTVNYTPFIDTNTGQSVSFLNLPIDATTSTHRDIVSASSIPPATGGAQTALVGATYLGTQNAAVSPDTPPKVPPDDTSYSAPAGGVLAAIILRVEAGQAGQSLAVDVDDDAPNAPGSAVVVFTGTGTETIELAEDSLGDGAHGEGVSCPGVAAVQPGRYAANSVRREVSLGA